MDIEIVEGKIDNIEELKELWELLRAHHEEKSIHFKRDFKELTFEKRIEKIKEKVEENEKVKVLIALDKVNNQKVGYCIGSISCDNKGNLDSLFVLEDYRNHRIGDKLLKKMINWLENNKTDDIYIGVASGNEDVFSFYENYGFYPVVTKLKK
ncbi:MAG: GNAT family N-acetyltransferase, partial [Kosmotogaceae bacterium]